MASLVDGQVGRSRVNSVLGELAASGLVLRVPHPPTVLYQLNREHVAAPFVEGLANMRHALLDRIRSEAQAWSRPAAAVWLFGSAARGEGSADSDIDILVVRFKNLDEDEQMWRTQLSQLEENVRRWSGNPCAVLELSMDELSGSVRTGHKLDPGRGTSGASFPSATLTRRWSPTRPSRSIRHGQQLSPTPSNA